MSKIVIDFKHEDVHQPKPWPIGIKDGVVTSGLGKDDGSVFIGLARKGTQEIVYLADELDITVIEGTDEFVPVFSDGHGFFDWDIAIRGIRVVTESDLSESDEPEEKLDDQLPEHWPTTEEFDKAHEHGSNYARQQIANGATEAQESPLSGEWADGPTPRTVAFSVDYTWANDGGDAVDELANAWERGYFDVFEHTA